MEDEEVLATPPRLSAREAAILRQIAGGQSNSEIAQHLSLSVKTVEFYVTRLLRKLGARSRVELALWWVTQATANGAQDTGADPAA